MAMGPPRFLSGARFLVALCLAASTALGAESFIVAPLAVPGPYAVACSNVAQDFTRLRFGEDVQLYWEGVPRDSGAARDPFDLFSDPANTPSVNVRAPTDFNLFG